MSRKLRHREAPGPCRLRRQRGLQGSALRPRASGPCGHRGPSWGCSFRPLPWPWGLRTMGSTEGMAFTPPSLGPSQSYSADQAAAWLDLASSHATLHPRSPFSKRHTCSFSRPTSPGPRPTIPARAGVHSSSPLAALRPGLLVHPAREPQGIARCTHGPSTPVLDSPREGAGASIAVASTLPGLH